VTAVAVECRPLETGIFAVFLSFCFFSAAEDDPRRKNGPPLFVECLEGEGMDIAFGKPLILIFLHFINNYYEYRPIQRRI